MPAVGSRCEISVVLPMFNEEAVIRDCLRELGEQLEKAAVSHEIVCVDDGSSDNTAALVDEAARGDPRIVLVSFSRNFGKEAALAAGLETARGQAVVVMDADLQHPPSLVSEMILQWRRGFEVVEAVKRDRGEEGFLYKWMAWLFNRLMGRAFAQSFAASSDFKLLDRQVVDALLEVPERRRFFRGLVAWVGFRTIRVPFTVQPRRAGHTKWSRGQLISYAVRNLVAFSSAPLRVIAWVGFGTVFAAGFLALEVLKDYFTGQAVSGFTTVILVTLILCGLTLISLGVIAIYIAGIYDEQKKRPLYLTRCARPERGAES